MGKNGKSKTTVPQKQMVLVIREGMRRMMTVEQRDALDQRAED